jgi:GTP cyclohydrolase IA
VTEHINLGWGDIEAQAARIAGRWEHADIDSVYGVPQGGYPVAMLVGQYLGAELILGDQRGSDGIVKLGPSTLVVDDLVDSGRTAAPFIAAGCQFDALYRKPHSPADIAVDAALIDGWLVFPWERATGPEDAVVRLLQHIGENPSREGLLDTPRRVVKALTEMTAGYGSQPADVLGTVFDEHSDEMVVLRNITFASMCEHHMLPFTGTATVGYVPDRKVVGLSKMARLVEMYARRLQVQERMTTQIADAMWSELRPLGVGVVVHGHHSCMGVRGVNQPGGVMVTSAMLGCMKHSDAARSEFLRLANGEH